MRRGAPFDLVLLDLTIVGGLGGKPTAQRLLELDAAARLIAASGYSIAAVLSDGPA
jgi:hypothetical protein